MTLPNTIRPPSDKSITLRALTLAGLATGRSVIEAPLTSLDARSMADVLRRLGVEVSPLRGGQVVVDGRGFRGLQAPTRTLHCGNSGTAARFILGVLSGCAFEARVTGDASLRGRPMRRVTIPLARMGAHFEELNGDGLPLRVRGGSLGGIDYDLPVASAQVKSAILLAALVGTVPVSLREPGRSRDHTERMLGALGARLATRAGRIEFEPPERLPAFGLRVPGDPSSAAFMAAAALLSGRELTIEEVGINPARTGFVGVLQRMGAAIHVTPGKDRLGEPVGEIAVSPGELSGTEVDEREVPALIDEVPVLAVIAASARGRTMFRGVEELKVKESDRLTLLATNLRSIGCLAEVSGDSLTVEGSARPFQGRVETGGDHRMAMAFAVLGAARAGSRIELSEKKSPAVSYPSFFADLERVLSGG